MPCELEDLFAKARRDFPMLAKSVNGHPFRYLDSAATAQKPQCVIDAYSSFLGDSYGTVHRAVYTTAARASDAYERVREKVRAFLNAEETYEVIFTRGTTEAINLVASSFSKAFIRPGDEILITEMEHHSNIVPWQLAAEAAGAQLLVVPFDARGVLDLGALERMLSERTKIVAVAHISNALGTINPIEAIARMAHAAGAKILVDGAQSAAHLPIDVQAMGADFFAFSGHKIAGPTGIGVLYGKAELLDAMPPFLGGGDMIETVTFEKTTYNKLPLKFEAGTPSIAEVIALGAAIDYITHLGLERIGAWEELLKGELASVFNSIEDIEILGSAPDRAPLFTFSVSKVHPLDIATLLDLRGLAIRSGHLCAQPVMRHFNISAAARASLAFYNNRQDVFAFGEALCSVLRQLR